MSFSAFDLHLKPAQNVLGFWSHVVETTEQTVYTVQMKRGGELSVQATEGIKLIQHAYQHVVRYSAIEKVNRVPYYINNVTKKKKRKKRTYYCYTTHTQARLPMIRRQCYCHRKRIINVKLLLSMWIHKVCSITPDYYC